MTYWMIFVNAWCICTLCNEYWCYVCVPFFQSWNFLTRTNCQYEFISVRLTIFWVVGFILRYFLLLPLRILILIIGVSDDVFCCYHALFRKTITFGKFLFIYFFLVNCETSLFSCYAFPLQSFQWFMCRIEVLNVWNEIWWFRYIITFFILYSFLP